MTTQAQGKLPAVSFEAAGSGRVFRLDALERAAVLICHTRESSEAAGRIVMALRDRYPESGALLVANVADLRGIPGFVRGMVRGIMAQAYRDNLHHIPDDRDPADYVVILPDWEGAVLKAAGVNSVKRTPAVIVADAAGVIQTVYQGDAPVAHALDALADLL